MNSHSGSGLSSPISNATDFADLYNQSTVILDAYRASRGDDIPHAVLKGAIEHLPMEGRLTMMRDIVENGEQFENLEELGQNFIDSVLKPSAPPSSSMVSKPTQRCTVLICFPVIFKRSPPSMSPSPSPEAHQAIDVLMGELSSSSRSRQLREACLRRDGFRCVASGIVDGTSYTAGRVRHQKHEYPPSPTKCAHLIPFGLRHVELENTREVCFSKLSILFLLLI